MRGSARRPKPSVRAARPDPVPDFSGLPGLTHVAAAVSGGSDSMALLRLLDQARRTASLFPKITVLTVDHGLREAAAAEAAKVQGWCAALGLPHQTLRWEGEKPLAGIQARARRARYDLMSAWCRSNDAQALLTAHTMDDQAETVLMRLARTNSPDSLAGIPARGQWAGLPLLRPLLGMRRAALRRLLQAAGQNWIEDPSNEDPRYERVRIRRTLAEDEAQIERLAALAKTSAETVERLDNACNRWIAIHLTEDDWGYCHAPRQALEGLPAALVQRILGRIIRHYGGGTGTPEREELVRLAQWMGTEGPLRRTLAGAVLGKRRDRFWVAREAARIEADPVLVGRGGQVVWDHRFVIRAPSGSEVRKVSGVHPAQAEGVPVHARLSYPEVVVPQGHAQVAFLRLISS